MRGTPIEDIIDAYKATGSVWRAGKQLGLAGQTVHERLRTVGFPMAARQWTQDELEELRNLYEASVPLAEIAHRLGRTYAGVASQANELGIRANKRRTKKIPRGAGYDKVTVKRHLQALDAYAGKVTQYARANGLNIEILVQAIQRHFPDEWRRYVAQHSDLPQKTCPYCQDVFIPANGKQVYCHRQCAASSRIDASYFGGKRRSTVGLAEGVCQLCERKTGRGLSSHHVLGKENDPENDVLIALCSGCHKLVTLVASRTFVDNPRAWEALISLAWFRRHGADIAPGPPLELYVEVEIDVDTDPDEEAA